MCITNINANIRLSAFLFSKFHPYFFILLPFNIMALNLPYLNLLEFLDWEIFIEFLYSIDQIVFLFIHKDISNSLTLFKKQIL